MEQEQFEKTFSTVSKCTELIWKQVQQELHVDILLDKAPKQVLKLYQLDSEDIHIKLEEVGKWSQENLEFYNLVKENGYADFLCNQQQFLAMYTELLLDNQGIDTLNDQLLLFNKLNILRLNDNRIKIVQNIPQNLKELHLFKNSISSFHSRTNAENLQYLGLGHNNITDEALTNISNYFPQLYCLDLSYNSLVGIDIVLDNLVRVQNLKMLSLFGNPISLLQNYRKYVLTELPGLKYFDQQQIIKQEEQDQNQTQGSSNNLSSINIGLPSIQKKNSSNLFRMDSQMSAGDDNGGKPFRFESDGASINEFQFNINVSTLELTDGILLEQSLYPDFDKDPTRFQSSFWVDLSLPQGARISSKEKPVLFQTITKEDDEQPPRIDFEFVSDEILSINSETRDFFRKGIILFVYRRDPVVDQNPDTGDIKPVLDTDGLPKTLTKELGICYIRTKEWVQPLTQQREIACQYRLFNSEVLVNPEFHYPLPNQRDLLIQNKETVDKLIKEMQEKLKPKEPEVVPGQKDAQQKDIKQPPEKQAPVKGKGGQDEREPEKQTTPYLTWPVDERDQVYIDGQKIVIAQLNYLLACKIYIE